MAKTRSPNYPVVSLGEAIEAVRPVFKAENRNKMSRKVLAENMGYSSLNGRALGKIGAVRAYGLTEGSGDELRLSEDAIVLLTAPAGSAERGAALRRCALRPALFQELSQIFESLPSEGNLRFELIKRRFTEEAAAKATNHYLDSMRLATGDGGSYNVQAQNEERDPVQTSSYERATPVKGKSERAEFPLIEGVARLEFPSSLSAASYEELETWLQLILRRAKRGVSEEE